MTGRGRVQLLNVGYSAATGIVGTPATGIVGMPEGRHYSCRSSSGRSVVLVDEAAEPVAAADLADR
jgi:hypothetical protein